MKKATVLLWCLALLTAVVAWGMMGVKILNHDYNITVEAYILLAAIIFLLVLAFCRIFSNRCPHCSRLRISAGKYCPYCGKAFPE